MATKERHKGVRKGQESLIKGFEAGLTAEGIADQHDDEINRVVLTKTRSGKTDALLDAAQDTCRGQHLSESRHFC
jgi:hypothetical protein